MAMQFNNQLFSSELIFGYVAFGYFGGYKVVN